MCNYTETDIAIIGGGASGLMAAISAGRYLKSNNKKINISILEKENRVGKKILMTGNGKCNITNTNTSPCYYNNKSFELVDSVLNRFSYKFIIELFEKLGLVFKEDSLGRVYPYSEQATAVLDVMRIELDRLNIKEICDFNIKALNKKGNYFIIESDKQNIKAKKLIVATGGKASTLAYKNTDIYSPLQKFGHNITEIFPSLVQIKTDSNIIKSIKGMRTPAKISVVADKKILRQEIGELQFTENALSGICAFQISRLISEFFKTNKINTHTYRNVSIIVDLVPYMSEEELQALINKRVKNSSDLSLDCFFTGFLNKRIGLAFLKSIGISPLSREVSSLTPKEIKKIINTLKNWNFNPTGTMPFKNAQVTAGGIKTNEFYKNSLESKKQAGLFACGEVLDVDGDCGGFNLQWAWSSGYLAGLTCAKQIIKEEKHA